jgi:hypothetical protein
MIAIHSTPPVQRTNPSPYSTPPVPNRPDHTSPTPNHWPASQELELRIARLQSSLRSVRHVAYPGIDVSVVWSVEVLGLDVSLYFFPVIKALSSGFAEG